MTTKISESGIIGADGKLRMPMDRLKSFFAKHCGQRVVVVFEAAEPGSTELQKAYYENYVVPTIQAAFFDKGTRMTTSATDEMLVDEYPGDKMIGNAVATKGRELSQSQMSDFLEWLKQYAAENLAVYVEDPQTI